MKTLIMIRHADAEQIHGNDSHRKLTEHGNRQAETLAHLLLNKGYKIDKIFASPSVRTKETVQLIAQVQQVAEKDIRYFENLYLGDTLQITEAINWLQESVQTLAIVAHNPGVTNFTNDVTGADIEGMPTAGFAVIDANCEDWQNFNDAEKLLVETGHAS